MLGHCPSRGALVSGVGSLSREFPAFSHFKEDGSKSCLRVIPKIMRQMCYKMAKKSYISNTFQTWVSHHSRINSPHAVFLSCLIIYLEWPYYSYGLTCSMPSGNELCVNLWTVERYRSHKISLTFTLVQFETNPEWISLFLTSQVSVPGNLEVNETERSFLRWDPWGEINFTMGISHWENFFPSSN